MGVKTLRQAVELFLDEQIKSTRTSYEYVMRDLMQAVGADHALTKISPEALVVYLQAVRQRPAIKSPATVNKYSKTIKCFFNWCVKMSFTKKSPANVLRLERTHKQIRKSKAMTDSELDRLLDYAKWKPRENALIRFLADTGCRARGAAHLTIHDLDLEAKTAIVTEKGDVTRTVWYGDACVAALKDWLKYRSQWLADNGYVLQGPYVFDWHGRPFKDNHAIGTIVRRACLKVGLRSLGSHSLRHRKGHQFADAGIAPSIAAVALGHHSPTITLQFYYPSDTDRAEAAVRQLATQAPEMPPITLVIDEHKTIDFRRAVGD